MKPKNIVETHTPIEKDRRYLKALINQVNSGTADVPEKSNDSRVEKLDMAAIIERIKEWFPVTLGFGFILFIVVGMLSFAVETEDWSIFLVLPFLALMTYPFYSRKCEHLPYQMKGLISAIILTLLTGLTFVFD